MTAWFANVWKINEHKLSVIFSHFVIIHIISDTLGASKMVSLPISGQQN